MIEQLIFFALVMIYHSLDGYLEGKMWEAARVDFKKNETFVADYHARRLVQGVVVYAVFFMAFSWTWVLATAAVGFPVYEFILARYWRQDEWFTSYPFKLPFGISVTIPQPLWGFLFALGLIGLIAQTIGMI